MADSIIALPPWFKTELQRLSAGEIRLEAGSNKPLSLSTNNAVWLIAQGKVEIFAIPGLGAKPLARRHIATLSPGEVFLCSEEAGWPDEGCEQYAQLELVAIPHSQAKLVRIDTAAFEQIACDPVNAALIDEVLQRWASRMQNILLNNPPPSSIAPLSTGQSSSMTVTDASVQSAENLVWVRCIRGAASLCGYSDLIIEAGNGPFPLFGNIWLTAKTVAEIECIDIREMFSNGLFWTGVGFLHNIVLRFIAGLYAADINANRGKLEARIQMDAEALKSANVQLAGIFTSKSAAKIDDSGPPRKVLSSKNRAGNDLPPAVIGMANSPVSPEPVQGVEDGTKDPLVETCRLVGAALRISIRIIPNLPQKMPFAQKLQRICDASLMHNRKVLLRGEWWRDDHGPLIGLLDEKINSDGALAPHIKPVALFYSSLTGYEFIDPVSGTSGVVNAVLCQRLHEEAYMLYPAATESLAGPRDLVKRVLQRHHQDLWAILLMGLVAGLLNLAVPIVTSLIYGRVIPHGYSSEVRQFGLMLFAAAFGACGFQITRALSMLRLTSKVEIYLQPLVWSRLLALPVSFFRHFRVGDLADRVQGIGSIRELLLADVTTTALALISSITSFALLFYYSWRFALLATGLIVCLIGATVVIARIQIRHSSRSIEIQGKTSSLAFAFVQGIAKLRSSGAEIRSYGLWAHQMAAQCRFSLLAQNMTAVQSGLNAFYLIASELALFALMGFGLTKHLSLSGFLAFSAAFGQIQSALFTFLTLLPALLTVHPIYQRLLPVLKEPVERDENKSAIILSGDIEVRNVSFRYHQQGSLVLDNLSFKASCGQFIAIVGPSGSGKSTLIRLLLGFECPTLGAVLYDNMDLSSLDVKAVRRQIGTVLQNSKPITGDIFTNIVGSNSNDLKAAWEAARIAGLENEIKLMPMGMHTMIGEGATTFSGGEKQRLMIARAVVNKPKIILLDEATSALDNPTQDKVQRCLEEMKATRIVIAHRLSTVRNADRIYVLDEGRIVEEGTYQDLVNCGGYFAQMSQRQI